MRRISLIIAFGICSAIALMGYPQIGHALGLGKLKVVSGLGQPLELEIEVHSVTAAEVDTLVVSLAARSDFSRAGLDYPEIGKFLVFELVQDSNDNYSVLISTGEPVQDTFLHLLVSASWSGGKVIREYTALLDPPLYSGRAATDVTVAKSQTAPEVDSTVISDVSEASDPVDGNLGGGAETRDSVDPAASAGGGKEVLVVSGDTLSDIVNGLGKPAGVTHYQALLAVYRHNPGAFIENNMNLLRKGATLKVPSFTEMEAVTKRESMTSFSEQLSDFKQYRTTRNAVTQKQEIQAGEDSGQSVDRVAGQPDNVQTEAIVDTESDRQSISTAGIQPTDATLTIGQQIDENQSVTASATSNDEIAALRTQLAQLDESLLASGVESESVRQSLEQIQNQVERMSTLIQLEDTNLALAQNRAQQSSAEVGARVEELLLEASLALNDQGASDTGIDPMVGVESETSTESEEEVLAQQLLAQQDVVQQTGELLQQDQDAAGFVAADAGSGQPADDLVDAPMATSDNEESAKVIQTAGTDEAGPDQVDSSIVAESESESEPESEAASGTAARKVAQSSLFDSVKNIFSVLPEYGLKIAAGLLALIAGLFFWQRRKSRKEFDASMLDIETEEVSMNSEASIQRMSSATGIDLASGNDSALELTIGGGMSYLSEEGIAGVNEEENEVIKAGAVDPLAEADVYLAYDRDEQAIQVLKEAYADNPERGELAEKLLEIYHKQDDRRSFDAIASELYRRRDTTHNFSWDKVRGMGREVSPDNTLYSTGPDPADGMVNLELDSLIRDELDDKLSDASESLLAKKPGGGDLDNTELDISGVKQSGMLDDALEMDDLDLGMGQDLAEGKRDPGLDTPTLSQIVGQFTDKSKDSGIEPVDEDEEVSLQTGDLQFDLGQDDHQFNQLEEESRRAIESSTTETGETVEQDESTKHDLLVIGEDSALTEMSESSISKLEPYHESETALELAKAYIELGEQDIAKGFIEEVLNEGSEKQKGKARKLVRELAT